MIPVHVSYFLGSVENIDRQRKTRFCDHVRDQQDDMGSGVPDDFLEESKVGETAEGSQETGSPTDRKSSYQPLGIHSGNGNSPNIKSLFHSKRY